MDMRTGILASSNTACVPEGPSRGCCCAGDAGGCRLEEVEFVCWIVVDGATNYGQEGQEKTAADENDGDDGENGPCDFR